MLARGPAALDQGQRLGRLQRPAQKIALALVAAIAQERAHLAPGLSIPSAVTPIPSPCAMPIIARTSRASFSERSMSVTNERSTLIRLIG